MCPQLLTDQLDLPEMETARGTVEPCVLIIWDWDLRSLAGSQDSANISAAAAAAATCDDGHDDQDDDETEDEEAVPSLSSSENLSATMESVVFKCIGVTKSDDRQMILDSIVARHREGKEQLTDVPVRMQPEPTNPVDSRAIAFECLYQGSWHVIGYVVSELLDEVHLALSQNKIEAVQFATIRYVLHYPDSGPGYFAGIKVSYRGSWSLTAIQCASTLK